MKNRQKFDKKFDKKSSNLIKFRVYISTFMSEEFLIT